MKFNLYKLSLDNDVELLKSIKPEDISSSVLLDLNKLQEEIVKLYFKKQHQRPGVKTLGNSIRYSPSIQEIFLKQKKYNLVKSTGNREGFFKVFLESIKNVDNYDAYFIILDKEFGNLTQLVDQTFIKIDEIIKNLSLLFEEFKLKHYKGKIYFIELTGFDGYVFVKHDNGYTRIYKENK